MLITITKVFSSENYIDVITKVSQNISKGSLFKVRQLITVKHPFKKGVKQL